MRRDRGVVPCAVLWAAIGKGPLAATTGCPLAAKRTPSPSRREMGGRWEERRLCDALSDADPRVPGRVLPDARYRTRLRLGGCVPDRHLGAVPHVDMHAQSGRPRRRCPATRAVHRSRSREAALDGSASIKTRHPTGGDATYSLAAPKPISLPSGRGRCPWVRRWCGPPASTARPCAPRDPGDASRSSTNGRRARSRLPVREDDPHRHVGRGAPHWQLDRLKQLARFIIFDELRRRPPAGPGWRPRVSGRHATGGSRRCGARCRAGRRSQGC
jgi:hypothetical protein